MGLENLPEKTVDGIREKDIPLLEAKARTNNNNGGADKNKVCDMFTLIIVKKMVMTITLRWRANVWCWLGQLVLGKPLVSIFTLDRWSSGWQCWFIM